MKKIMGLFIKNRRYSPILYLPYKDISYKENYIKQKRVKIGDIDPS